MSEISNFQEHGKSFQEKLVCHLTKDRVYCDRLQEVLKVEFLELKHLQIFTKLIFDYRDKYKRHPGIETVQTLIRTELKNESVLIKNLISDYFSRVERNLIDETDAEYIKEESLDFCRKQAVKEAMLISMKKLKHSSYDEISTIINESLRKGEDNSLGHDYTKDVDLRYEKTLLSSRISTGWEHIDNIIGGGLPRKKLGLVVAGTGRGKCYGKNTEIMMFNGKPKKASEIEVGDLLLGPDGKKRTVLNLSRGKDLMYEINPIKGKKWICNSEHILVVYNSKTKKNHQISVKDFIKKSKTFQNHCKLIQSDYMEFEKREKPFIDPYFYGLWVGDGSKRQDAGLQITNIDEEVINYSQQIAEQNNLSFSYSDTRQYFRLSKKNGEKNQIKQELNKIWTDGSIIDDYKFGDKKTRLEFLAGFLDADGYNHYNNFEFVQKNKKTAEDVSFIARSLGFKVVEKEKIINGVSYCRNIIIGDCSQIPVKINRKKATKRLQKKNPLVTGFSIKEIGINNYYGWENDQDHLHLLKDFTISHNSMVMTHIAAKCVEAQYNVLYLTLELDDKEVAQRCDSVITGIPLDELFDKKEEIKNILSQKQLGKLFVKEYPTRSVTLNGIRSLIEKAIRNNEKPDIVLVDYADLLKVNLKGEKYEVLEYLFEELRSIAQEYDVALWTASQTNRGGTDEKMSMDEGIAGSYGKLKVIDFGFRIIRNDEEKQANYAKFQVFKNRLGPDGIWFKVFMDLSKVAIDVLGKLDLNAEKDNLAQMMIENRRKNEEKRQESLELLKKIKSKKVEIDL